MDLHAAADGSYAFWHIETNAFVLHCEVEFLSLGLLPVHS